jgi:hypothetical protein
MGSFFFGTLGPRLGDNLRAGENVLLLLRVMVEFVDDTTLLVLLLVEA